MKQRSLKSISLLMLILSLSNDVKYVKAQSISYEDLLNITAVNCSATLPTSALDYMSNFSAAFPNSSQMVCFSSE